MNLLQTILAIYIAGGALAWSAWCVHTFATKALAPKSDWTSFLIFKSGEALVWIFALVVAGALVGSVAWTVVRALGAA